MPVNHLQYALPAEQSLQDAQQTQTTKYCSHCSSPLNTETPNASFFSDDHDSNIVCGACRARLRSTRSDDPTSVYVNHGRPVNRSGLPNIDTSAGALSGYRPEVFFDDDTEAGMSPASTTDFSISSTLCSISPPPTLPPQSIDVTSTKPLAISIRTTLPIDPHRLSPTSEKSPHAQELLPDPSIDITRLRVRPQGYHCLYPGATFKGTQKSGRNSYGVTVTIVDVDLSSSFLCGYLCIRGLTEDWPELTTYFDAEIIGSRYGFLTQKWGASEHEDLLHWQRFPSFRHVRSEVKPPHLTIPDRDRGAVFMRWKERFLVPDHKVHDINGASFAGFYYVCVEFNPQSTSSNNLRSAVIQENDDTVIPTSPSASRVEPVPPGRRRRDSSARRVGRGSSIGPRSPPPTATMSGLYYHQNSEPYQQLSLSHVPERSSSSFEFR
ncbi:vacuolar import and degradation protein-domain-containing protein [Scleroderma yunnanense]